MSKKMSSVGLESIPSASECNLPHRGSPNGRESAIRPSVFAGLS
jgi:hypothetical protein